MKSLRFILLCFSFCFTFHGLAQEHPLPIEKLRPIIDSVQTEVNRLYHLAEATHKAIKFAKKQGQIIPKEEGILSYQIGDTTVVLFLSTNDSLISNYLFKGVEIKFLRSFQNKFSLSEQEKILLNAKRQIIAEAQKKKYETQLPEDCAFDYVFYPNQKGFTLYVLMIPVIDSILPLGGDRVFIFDHELKLLSFENAKRVRLASIRQKDNAPYSKLEWLSAGNHSKTNDFKILIPYYYKFRRYHHNLLLK